ncbi:hypothetical protein N8987_07535 [Crocinitomix sp.]|nr:hypothetical protein [Crocinitomix sp.]
MKNTNSNPLHKRQGQDTNKEYAKQLFKALYNEPLSRRMAATKIGLTDQTYMVTQFIYDWLKTGKAQVIVVIKCTRSGRKVEMVTTNSDLFISSNTDQLNLFE